MRGGVNTASHFRCRIQLREFFALQKILDCLLSFLVALRNDISSISKN